MALVTIVGYPCSGKTRFAVSLAEDITSRLASPSYTGPKFTVSVVDDDSSHVSRAVYDSEFCILLPVSQSQVQDCTLMSGNR